MAQPVRLAKFKAICKPSILFGILVYFYGFMAFAASGITYHGRILRSDGLPVSSATTQFRIQVRSPGAESCLLWEEQQTKDLSSTNGVFSITINDVNEPSLITNTLPFSLERVFSNKTAYTGLANCSVGTSYTPSSTVDGRNLVAYFRESPSDAWEQLPALKINFVPLSLNSVQLEGMSSQEFLKIESAASQTPLTVAQVNTLLDLVNGASVTYLKSTDSTTGDLAGTYSATVVDGLQNTPVSSTAPTLNQILKFNGTAWAPANETMAGDASYAAKGIVQFDTDAATSGLQVTAGVARLADVITANTVGNTRVIPVITYDAKGRLTAVTPATVDDITKLSLDGTDTMTGNLNMGNQNITNTNSVSATSVGTRSVSIYDADNSNTVTLQTPADVTANYALTLPADDGTASGQVLTTDSNGVLSWSTPASGISVTANQAVIANGTGTGLVNFTCLPNQAFSFDGAGLPICQSVTPAGGFLNGGNSFGATANLGTNDAFDLNFKTGGITEMTIPNTGNINILNRSLSLASGSLDFPTVTYPRTYLSNNKTQADLFYNDASSSTTFLIGSKSATENYVGTYSTGSGGFHGMKTGGSYSSQYGFFYETAGNWNLHSGMSANDEHITFTAASSGVLFKIRGDWDSKSTDTYTHSNTANSGSILRLVRTRGDEVANLPVQTGDMIGELSFEADKYFFQIHIVLHLYVPLSMLVL